MDLLEIRNGHVFPTTEALTLSPYKDIWEEDTSENHEEALKMYAFIVFTCSPKKQNPFWGYKEEQRIEKVKERVFKDKDYEISLELMQACIEYKEDLKSWSASYSLIEDSMVTIEALREFLGDREILKKRTPTGLMIIKPKELMVALNELPKTVKNIEALRETIHEELIKTTKNRANRTIGRYERPPLN